MNVEQLLIYSIVSFFYIISPGPAIFLAISNGMTADAKAVIMSSMGNIVGLFVLSSASMLGLGALLAASATLFLIVKIVGASYLVYLGIKQFRAQQPILLKLITADVRQHRLPSYFREGFLLAVSNPKPILFFTAIFPQFLNAGFAIVPQFLIMTAIFMLTSFVSLVSYGYVSKSAKHLLADEKRMMWFHRLTGGMFIGMGLGLLQLKNSHS